MELRDKRILILGEGISGKGAFSALEGIAARYFYYDGCLTSATPDVIITSPGIAAHPALDYAKKNKIPVISELELGYLLNRSPVCAVTGTNGKTTVTRLIGDAVRGDYKTIVCGNIGDAFSALARTPHKLAVVEVSSFQLLDCHEFRPDIAVITNITPDHLDRHGNMDNYIAAKMRIAKNQTSDDFLICPLALRPLAQGISSTVLYSGADTRVENGKIYFLNEPVMEAAAISLTGEHNISNVLQSVCAAKLLGVANNMIREAVQKFKSEPHRFSLVSRVFDKNWYDDSKATNVAATLAACESVKGDTALLLGGSDKGYTYEELFLNLPDHVRVVYIMGEVRRKLAAAARGSEKSVVEVENLSEAVRLAAGSDVENVLLSPAAASFDCFQNYAQRGRAFAEAIEELGVRN
ncbi:MAG: UDP-N-acetylmuramoyl-L-alanine--D-glutamate ligase [Firmicutes bacterium]|nr:UDP-N-acetylmuramoyl-L-alanine--D-glutamate ligase [Bacillota bacterium]